MRALDSIIIHCSATPANVDVGVAEIREWHLRRGFSDIGYHFVIRRDGTVEPGRAVDQVGAHCKNHNALSIGVCLVGGIKVTSGQVLSECNFTDAQWKALVQLLSSLRLIFPSIKTIHGHNEFAPKDCPCFNVQQWLQGSEVLADD